MTATEIECTPFDALGKIVAPSPEIFAKLKKQEPEKFEKLSAMLTANVAAEDAEENMRRTEKDLYAAVSAAQLARSALEKLKPQTTHVEELRRVIAAQAGNPLPPPAPNPNAMAAAIAADTAEELVVKLRSDFETARLVLKNRRATLAEKIMAWQGVVPKRDTEWLVRENVRADLARKMKRVEQGLSPDEAPEIPRHRWPIETAMTGRGQRIGLRGEPPARTSTVRELYARKVPSER
jgi:hypothetical protein